MLFVLHVFLRFSFALNSANPKRSNGNDGASQLELNGELRGGNANRLFPTITQNVKTLENKVDELGDLIKSASDAFHFLEIYFGAARRRGG